jgi:hypothetical protein
MHSIHSIQSHPISAMRRIVSGTKEEKRVTGNRTPASSRQISTHCDANNTTQFSLASPLGPRVMSSAAASSSRPLLDTTAPASSPSSSSRFHLLISDDDGTETCVKEDVDSDKEELQTPRTMIKELKATQTVKNRRREWMWHLKRDRLRLLYQVNNLCSCSVSCFYFLSFTSFSPP